MRLLPHGPSALIAALWVLLAVSPATFGQGTGGLLPDPITGRDVSAWARALEASDPQCVAIDRFHETYLADCRTLRETEIERFLAEVGAFSSTLMFMPDAERLERAIADLDALLARIRALDESFFDRMTTVLTETQAAALPGVRQRRARTRLLAGAARYTGFLNRGARVDLSTLLDPRTLTPRERAAADPLIAEYEGKLTTAARALHDAARTMFQDLAERLAELSREDDLEPATRWRAVREFWAEVSVAAIERAAAISALNRRTVRTIRSVLDDETARRLQIAFHRAAYPDVARGETRALDRYDAALGLEGLDAEERAWIVAARTDLRARHDRLAQEMIELIETQRREGGPLRGFGRGARPGQAELETLQASRDAVNEQAIAALRDVLGSTLADGLPAAVADAATDGGGSASPSTTGSRPGVRDPGGALTATRTASSVSDPFLPDPITTTELLRYRRRLGLDDEEMGVLETLHADHLDAWTGLQERHLDPVLESVRQTWTRDPRTGRVQAPSIEHVDRLYEKRVDALAAIRAAEAALFDDSELALVPADDPARRVAMLRVRLDRERVVLSRVGAGSPRAAAGNAPGRPSSESTIDLALLVDELALSGPDRRAVDERLLEYERDLATALRRRYDLRFDYERARDRLGVEGARSRGADRRALRATLGAPLAASDRAIVTLNRTTLETLAGQFEETPAAALRRSYLRRAHPEIYDDPDAVEPRLLAALALDDLTDAQRSLVSDALTRSRDELETVRTKMMELERRRERARSGSGRADWQERRQERNAMERLRFERRELNDRWRRRLRSILDDEQAARAGLALGVT